MAGLTIIYFAWVREATGCDSKTMEHPGPDVTIAALMERLAATSAGHAAAFADPARVRAALDQNFVPLDTPLGNARELALFPPVTGG